MKKDLLWIAGYERECYTASMKHLGKEKEVKEETMKALRCFVDVTDLYGQMYLARDITTRIRGEGYQRERRRRGGSQSWVDKTEVVRGVTREPEKIQKPGG